MEQRAIMPRYWLLCVSEDNYEVARAHGLIGMSEHAARAIHRIGVGDLIIFYINRKKVDSAPTDPAAKVQRFRGVAKVCGEAFESNDLIWHIREGELFPHRRPVEFLSDVSARVRPLIEQPSFVTNMKYWALPLRRGYVEMTTKDFETIQAAMEGSGR
jgi:predicted RNA-binding protein